MYNQKTIQALSETMQKSTQAELELWRVPEDLAELYDDLSLALVEKDPNYAGLMPRYAVLMQAEQEMLNPYDAYTAGQKCTASDERMTAFMRYLSDVLLRPDNQKMLGERDALFQNICDILRRDKEQRGLLINDYTEIFRQYHGALRQRIDYFFDLGYFRVQEINSGELPLFIQISPILRRPKPR